MKTFEEWFCELSVNVTYKSEEDYLSHKFESLVCWNAATKEFQTEIKALKEELAKERDVVNFYADKSSWNRDYEIDSSISEMTTRWIIAGEDLYENDYGTTRFGGAKAHYRQSERKDFK